MDGRDRRVPREPYELDRMVSRQDLRRLPRLYCSEAMETVCVRLDMIGVDRAVWRAVRMPTDATLRDLHHVIQIAFGWSGREPHCFRVGDAIFGARGDADANAQDEAAAALSTLPSKLLYEYEFGDDAWEVDVTLESGSASGGLAYVGGTGAAPPEEVGGPEALRLFRLWLAEADDSTQQRIRAWLGTWQPDRFDESEIRTKLAKLAEGARPESLLTPRQRGRAPWLPVLPERDPEAMRFHERARAMLRRHGEDATITISATTLLRILEEWVNARMAAQINDQVLRQIESGERVAKRSRTRTTPRR